MSSVLNPTPVSVIFSVLVIQSWIVNSTVKIQMRLKVRSRIHGCPLVLPGFVATVFTIPTQANILLNAIGEGKK